MLHNFDSYIYLLIYIFLWAITFYRYYRKVKFTTGTIIMLSYLIYGSLAFFLYNNVFYGRDYKELTLFPFLYLFMMMYIFIMPLLKYERGNVMYVKTPSARIVNVFIVVYGICSLVTLPKTIASLQEGLALLLLDSDGGTDLYLAARDSNTARVDGVSGIYGLFSIVHNIFSDIAVFMVFYYLTLKNKNKYFLILLVIVFIADILYPLSKGGRTDAVMRSFIMTVAVSFFYPFYSERLKRLVKKIIIVVFLIISIPFMAMTISRFGERDGGTGGGMLRYIAQAPLNFNNYALDNGGIRNGDRTINYFKQLVGMNPPRDIFEVRFKYHHQKMDDGIFSTYVGDFVLDFGPLVAFVIFVIISFLFYRMIRISNKTIPFHSLLLVFFIACVAMQGGMYLFYFSFTRNLHIIAFIFMYIVFYIDLHSNQYHHNYLTKNNQK